MKNKEFRQFKDNIDLWVRDFQSRLEGIDNVPSQLDENRENIDHNYEIICEMRSEMIKLKEEISALRMIQLMHLEAQTASLSKIKR